MIKLGYLSFAFFLEDQTYWLTTGLNRPDWSFLVIPNHLFENYELKGGLSDSKSSEITVYDDAGIVRHMFSSIYDGEPIDLSIDAASRASLTWNEMIALLLDKNMPLIQLTDLFHHHIVRKTDSGHLHVVDVNYKVTAFLPPPEQEGVFAIWGEDYVASTNPNWITCHLPTIDEFRARLRDFKVVAVCLGGKYYDV